MNRTNSVHQLGNRKTNFKNWETLVPQFSGMDQRSDTRISDTLSFGQDQSVDIDKALSSVHR